MKNQKDLQDVQETQDPNDIEMQEEIQEFQQGSLEAIILKGAPYWLIAIGIHIVILLMASLISMERSVMAEENSVEVTIGEVNINPVDLASVEDLLDKTPVPEEQLVDPINDPTRNDPIIYYPDALPSDHNESADNENSHEMKGQSKEFLSSIPGAGGGLRGRQPGAGPGVYNSMGVGGGGGGGGRYGGRKGGMKNLRNVVRKSAGTIADKLMEAVIRGLLWLARHQNDDGSWSTTQFSKHCSGSQCSGQGMGYDVGATGLALLAFVGSGYVHTSLDTFVDPITNKKVCFGEVVKKGLIWLIASQNSEGCIGGKGEGKYIYNHAIATLALTEAYGMTLAPLLKNPTQKAIDFLIQAQNPGRVWRYSARCGDNDTSVTGWCAMVLKSADGVPGLSFPASTYKDITTWFDENTDTVYGQVGYNGVGTQAIRENERNANVAIQPSLTAIGIMERIFISKNLNDPLIRLGVNVVMGSLPKWDTSQKGVIDYYYWYYGTLAMFQYDGPDGSNWKKWNEAAIKNTLLPNQHLEKDGCPCGSWDPEVERWGDEGGRVYATAINVLSLEIYYRYPSAFGTKEKK
jgi:hypothetical protein